MKFRTTLLLILIAILIALVVIVWLNYSTSSDFKNNLDKQANDLQKQAESAVKNAINGIDKNNNLNSPQFSDYSDVLDANLDENVFIYFIDVGQGDSILIHYKSENILIDAGDNGKGKIVADYLKSKGISNLKYLIGTHSDADHIGGMDELLKSGISFKYYFGTYQSKDTKAYENLAKLTDDKKFSIFRGQMLDTKIPILILNPTQKLEFNEQNDNSVVLYVDLGEIEVLLMADCESACENSIMQANLPLKAEVLKVGHHGSHSSTGDIFLNKINPQVAVISVGKDNDYDHPHSETLDKLNQKNSKIYRTDFDGTITFTSNGENYFISTEKLPN